MGGSTSDRISEVQKESVQDPSLMGSKGPFPYTYPEAKQSAPKPQVTNPTVERNDAIADHVKEKVSALTKPLANGMPEGEVRNSISGNSKGSSHSPSRIFGR